MGRCARVTYSGEEGDNEPSLQWILDTFRIPVNVGDANVATGPIEGIVLPNSNNVPRFVKAGPGVVSIDTLAVFSGDTFAQPAAILGWYTSSASLTEQYRSLLATERVDLRFEPSGVRRLAELAYQVNDRSENIGARRLHTVLERLLETVSFEAADRGGQTVVVDAAYVDAHLAVLAQDDDLSRYIL